METIKVNTFLPVFPGFYNTIFEPDEESELHYINDERQSKGLEPLNSCEVEFNYEDYRQAVCEQACNYIEQELKHVVKAIKFEELNSPKYYNYSNDSIHCEIEIYVEKIKKYIIEYQDDFKTYLKRNYTPQSGFIPYHSNSPMDWYNNIEDQHKCGAILDFICENEEVTQYEMYENCFDCYLYAKDNHFEVNKIKCEKCGEYSLLSDAMAEYNNRKNKQRNIYIEIHGKEPRVMSFEKWVERNKIKCHKCKN